MLLGEGEHFHDLLVEELVRVVLLECVVVSVDLNIVLLLLDKLINIYASLGCHRGLAFFVGILLFGKHIREFESVEDCRETWLLLCVRGLLLLLSWSIYCLEVHFELNVYLACHVEGQRAIFERLEVGDLVLI